MIFFQIFIITLCAVYAANAWITGRIYKGTDVNDKSEIPYQIGLSCGGSWCGGSLLSQTWVLTAAHCVRNCRDGNIYMGSIYRGSFPFLFDGQTYSFTNNDYIVNEHYEHFTHDVALVKLSRNVTFTDKVKPIKLIPKEYSNQTQFDGKVVEVSGWGAITNKNPGFYTKLQRARVKVTTNEKCREDFDDDFITDEHICTTGDEAKGICAGDSGGPMVVRVNNERYLLGVASFINGAGCEARKARAFTRVSTYRDWISEKTNNEVK